jgi:hypothetical protein
MWPSRRRRRKSRTDAPIPPLTTKAPTNATDAIRITLEPSTVVGGSAQRFDRLGQVLTPGLQLPAELPATWRRETRLPRRPGRLADP